MAHASAPQLAQQLASSLEKADLAGFKALFAPGAVVWHNSDRKEVDAAENAEAIPALHQLVKDLRVRMVSFSTTSTGFVQQLVLEATVASSGAAVESHNCLVVRVESGKITRIDEYVDPALSAALA